MSRIGKKPIPIPDKVSVSINSNMVSVQGPMGKLDREIKGVNITIENSFIYLTPLNEDKKLANIWGLSRSLINNMVIGVSECFTKSLTVVGMGYKIEDKGKSLLFHVGFCKPVTVNLPEGITAKTDDRLTTVVLKGTSKEMVTQLAANIRKIKPPEPYKGKGILYTGEKIKLKAGKTGASAGK